MSLSPEADSVMQFFHTRYRGAVMTVRADVLKELLLYTDGKVLKQGRLYPIRSSYLNVGVYEAWLAEPTPIEVQQ